MGGNEIHDLNISFYVVFWRVAEKRHWFYDVFWGRRAPSTVNYESDFLEFQTVWRKTYVFWASLTGPETPKLYFWSIFFCISDLALLQIVFWVDFFCICKLDQKWHLCKSYFESIFFLYFRRWPQSRSFQEIVTGNAPKMRLGCICLPMAALKIRFWWWLGGLGVWGAAGRNGFRALGLQPWRGFVIPDGGGGRGVESYDFRWELFNIDNCWFYVWF